MSRLRRMRNARQRLTNLCRKEETCLIRINSFCISNETNLDSSPRPAVEITRTKIPQRIARGISTNIFSSYFNSAKFSAGASQEHLSNINASYCRKRQNVSTEKRWQRMNFYWSSPLNLSLGVCEQKSNLVFFVCDKNSTP